MPRIHVVAALAALASGAAAAAPFERLPPVTYPADNPTAPAKVELGKMLFFDPRLSLDGTISCNSCHNVMAGGEDGRPNSVGVGGQHGGRSAPTVWNAAYLSAMFWDSIIVVRHATAKPWAARLALPQISLHRTNVMNA